MHTCVLVRVPVCEHMCWGTCLGVRACARVCRHTCPCVCKCVHACVLAPYPCVCECVHTCLCMGWPTYSPQLPPLAWTDRRGSISRKSWFFSAPPQPQNEQPPFPLAQHRQKGKHSCWWVPHLPSKEDPAFTQVLGMSAGSVMISRQTGGLLPWAPRAASGGGAGGQELAWR